MREEIYGYWVGRDEIIEVPMMAHSDVGLEIMQERYHIPMENIFDSGFSVYQFMFKAGFIRVVNEYEDFICVQYHESTKLSRLQKQFVKEAGRIYTDSDNQPIDDLILEEYVTVQKKE